MRAEISDDAALDPAELLERASKFARLSDFGSGYEAALTAVTDCYREESRLGPSGRSTVSWHLIAALVTRLRLIDTLKRRPELFGCPLDEPLIIVGLPRSGTTFLHRLLSGLPEARFLPFWEAREPIPDADYDQRVDYYRIVADRIQGRAPDLEFKHPIDLHGPEECMYLLDPSLVSFSFTTTDAPCPAHFEWVLRADPHEPYRIYRLLLEYIQALSPGKRLMLKSPVHLLTLDALMQAVPEAKLVQTHRDPLQVVASACSLFESLHGPSVVGIDRAELGRETVEWLDLMIQRGFGARQGFPERAVFDLRFDELIRDPMGSVERIFAHCGWQWTDAAREAVQIALSRNPQRHFGRHRYQAADYGLSEGALRERFSGYRKRWGFSESRGS